MSLYDAMTRRGYTFRRHLEEEGWGWHEPTVVDLDTVQRDALEHGGIDGLKGLLAQRLYRPEWGLWTFPALDITDLPRCEPDVVLSTNGTPSTVVVAPGLNPELGEMAREIVNTIEERYGIRLPLIDDAAAEADILDEQHLIVVGGSHQNRLALKLALRYQTFFVDADVPGEGGWVVTTHTGIHAGGHNVTQITAACEHSATALGSLLDEVEVVGDRLVLRCAHHIEPGAVMQAHLPSWTSFVAGLPERLPQLAGQAVAASEDPQALADFLAVGLCSGGREKCYYNVAPVDIAVSSARYYQLSGDRRALQLFRELLFTLADYYLKTPGGASYPADLDFRLGQVILHYARLEHDPVFDGDDRLVLTNLLLACARAVHEYAEKFWPVKPNQATRHNHQTFKARTLLHAADYFGRFGLPCVDAWRAYADRVFSGDLWRRFKQKENANLYEGFVFEHAAAYSAFTGRGLGMFAKGRLAQAARRQMATTDNFFRPVDYGDATVRMRPTESVLARLAATLGDADVRRYTDAVFARAPEFLPEPVRDFPGLHLQHGQEPPDAGDWEHVPMEPAFAAEHAPGLQPAAAFDKLAFRTGWGDDDQYLLLEGVGGPDVGHAHCDVLGLVRMNHLGRHWIVSNGYGRRVGVTHAGQSFGTRIRGPEDHNMLVLTRGGEGVGDMPACATLLQHGRQGKLLFATGALTGYDGVDWSRTLIIFAGKYVLVIDRVQVNGPGIEAAHVEWNCLGRPAPCEKGFRLEQDRVFLHVTSDSGWSAEQRTADQSACWKRVLDGKEYSHARFPLTKLVLAMPDARVGQTHCLATLMAATRSEAAYTVAHPEPEWIRIHGPHEELAGQNIQDRDLQLRINAATCEVRFAGMADVMSKKPSARAKDS